MYVPMNSPPAYPSCQKLPKASSLSAKLQTFASNSDFAAGPILLGCSTAEPYANWKDLPPHQDEEQIRLDVDRSFVYYPTGKLSQIMHLPHLIRFHRSLFALYICLCDASIRELRSHQPTITHLRPLDAVNDFAFKSFGTLSIHTSTFSFFCLFVFDPVIFHH
jgi:hypothetical protein